MPSYRFDNPATGETRSINVPYATLREMSRGSDAEGYDLYEIDGVLWRRNFDVIESGVAWSGASWPIASSAAAVLPDQVESEKADLAKRGVRVDFTKDGRPIFENPAHRRKALKAMGLLDKLSYV